MALKPNEQIIVSAATATAVFAIFQLNAPNLSDVKASQPGGAAEQEQAADALENPNDGQPVVIDHEEGPRSEEPIIDGSAASRSRLWSATAIVARPPEGNSPGPPRRRR